MRGIPYSIKAIDFEKVVVFQAAIKGIPHTPHDFLILVNSYGNFFRDWRKKHVLMTHRLWAEGFSES